MDVEDHETGDVGVEALTGYLDEVKEFVEENVTPLLEVYDDAEEESVDPPTVRLPPGPLS